MYDLIVLGLVPGTHIQLTFQQWQILISCIFLGLAIHQLSPTRFQASFSKITKTLFS
jgi:hypothetical protein